MPEPEGTGQTELGATFEPNDCPRCGCLRPPGHDICPQCGLGRHILEDSGRDAAGEIDALRRQYARVARWATLSLVLSIAAILSQVRIALRGDLLGLCLVAVTWIWLIRRWEWGLPPFDLDAVTEYVYDFIFQWRLQLAAMCVALAMGLVIAQVPRSTVVAAAVVAVGSLVLRLVLPRAALRTLRREAPSLLAELRWTRVGLAALQLAAVAAIGGAFFLLGDHSPVDLGRLL